MKKNIFYIIICTCLFYQCSDRDPNYSIDPKAAAFENTGRDGCPDAVYPNWESSKYVLPYPAGATNRVDLSHCSLFNHGPGEIDQFATDFLLPMGSPVVAVREGLVVFKIEHNPDFSSENNLMVIQHSDNTFAQYVSLKQDGVLLEIGELVGRGQVIALSGATGASVYPHLHFIVTKDGYEHPYEGVPINFSNTDPNPLGLDSFKAYPAY